MKQVTALGAFVLGGLLSIAAPAFAISESSVTSATGGASVATVSVNAASGASLVALISGDGPSTASSQTTSVSGCGLSWVLVKRANTRPGVADVWKTATSASLSACTVTGRLVSGSFFVRLTVVVIDGSSGLGASASASGKNGSAKAMLASVQAGSLVYGVGSDWSVVQARTVLSAQRKLAESTPAGLGTFWAQALTGTSLAGSLTLGTSAPNSTNWNFAAVELLSSLAPPPPPPCTFTVSPTTLTAPAGGTSSSVTVTASASTCVWTAASNAWLSVTPTSGTGSGAVSVTSAANSGATRSASVTVAGTSVTVNQDAAVSGPPTLMVTCPGTQSATSPDGQPVAVSYPAATTTGGVAPITVQGSPASSSLFPVGTTMVTQTATSSDGQTATCTFGITVSTGPPPTGPTITGVSGTLVNGASIALTGSGFGTKPTAAPAAFETFEDGTLDALTAHGPLLYANTTDARHARTTRNARADFKSCCSGNFFSYDSATAAHWFVQYWIKLASNWQWGASTYGGPTDGLANIKIFRMFPTGSRNYPNIHYNFQGFRSNTVMLQVETGGGTTHIEQDMRTWFAPGVWHLVQVQYGENSGVDQLNGSITLWVDGVERNRRTDLNTNPSADGTAINKRPYIIGFYDSWPPSDATVPTMYAYYDDVYVDTSWARVELGNASTYAASTLREVQPVTQWADGQISVTANQGAFTAGQTAYLYVVTASGVTSGGRAVTIP